MNDMLMSKKEGGLRLKGIVKNTEKGMPLVSVVTVVYNGAELLRDTIRSITGQTYKNVEFIIIDGRSGDGTLEIIKEYGSAIDYWISEKDEGIYDAMNKGIELVRGEWINFMNAGDAFFSEKTVEEILPLLRTDAGLVYGKILIRYKDLSRVQDPLPMKRSWMRMPVSHQSVFARSALMRGLKFDTDLKLASDYDFLCKALNENMKMTDSGKIIASCAALGVSDSNRIKVIKEFWRVARNSFKNRFLIDCYYLLYLSWALVVLTAKKIIPEKLKEHALSIKYNRKKNK